MPFTARILSIVNAVISYGRYVHADNLATGKNRSAVDCMQDYFKSLLKEPANRNTGLKSCYLHFNRILQIGWYDDTELRRLNAMEEDALVMERWM